MTKTAAAWSTEHALNIQEVVASSLSIHNSETTEAPSAIVATSELFQGAYYRATSQLKYSDRLKVSLSVDESHRQHFILIKGLLEFHRSAGFVFSFNKRDGTFDVTTSAQQEAELNVYLRKISAWIGQELAFKRRLKEMLAFEREYRAKLAKVYTDSDGFTLFPTV